MSTNTNSTIEYESEREPEIKCNFCGEDRFNTAFVQMIHSYYYCLQNPNPLPPPQIKTDFHSRLFDGPQYYYPVEEDLARQKERQKMEKNDS